MYLGGWHGRLKSCWPQLWPQLAATARILPVKPAKGQVLRRRPPAQPARLRAHLAAHVVVPRLDENERQRGGAGKAEPGQRACTAQRGAALVGVRP